MTVHKEKATLKLGAKFSHNRQIDQHGSVGVGTLLLGPVSPPASGRLFLVSYFLCFTNPKLACRWVYFILFYFYFFQNKFIILFYLCISGCVGSSLLHVAFL